VVVTGDDGATFANRKARELGAWPAAPDGGIAPEAQPPWQLRDAGGRPVQRDGWPLRRALLRGEQVAAEAIQVVSPDGSASWFETSAGPVYGAGMEPLGAVMTLMDVTARNRLEKRQTLLARTSALVTSADHERKLSQSLARLFVPELADWCTVDVLDDSGDRVTRAGAAHRDPAREQALLAAAPAGRRPTNGEAASIGGSESGLAARTGAGDDTAPGTAHAATLAVPLHGRRGVVGVL